jgi:Toprim-like
MTLAAFLRRFNAKSNGSGYIMPCRAHGDTKASLSVNEGRDGRILLKCQAGCTTERVVAALGLQMRDLFPSINGTQKAPIVATYYFRDVSGEVRYRKQRSAEKEFWFERPDGQGGWTKDIKGVERVVYRVNELQGRTHIFIVEGEKDADRLWSLGLAATTNDAGASKNGQRPKWTDALTRQLKAAGVVSALLLPDNDDAGRAHMRAVAASLHTAGIEVRIVELPDLPSNGGDVSDYLDAGHQDLLDRCDAAPIYTPPINADTRPTPIVTEPRTLAEVHETFTHWLGPDYDLDAIDLVIANVASEKLGGDPLWSLLVSGSGNAKTETVQSLAGAGAYVTSTITSDGALLSASPKRETAKDATGGLLCRVGSRGILVIKDMTSILSMQSNTRAGVVAALREIHDGRWERNVGTNGGKSLLWKGRIVVVGAVTSAWDEHQAVISMMGDRFVLLRLDSNRKREAAGLQAIRNTGSEDEMRTALIEAVAGVLSTVEPARAITLNEDQQRQIIAAANLTTLCRTAVQYDYRGDPIDAHAPEMPTRFAKQLAQIVRGSVAVGMAINDAMRLAIRCARDSMPPLRLQILEDVAAHPNSQPQDVRVRLDKPWATVKRQLQSLYLLGVLTCNEEHPSEGEKTRFRYLVVPSLDVRALSLDATLRNQVARDQLSQTDFLSPEKLVSGVRGVREGEGMVQ